MTKTKPFRLKIIKPVYASLTVAEEARVWFSPDSPVNSSERIGQLFRYLEQETKEHFITCHLDNKNRLLCIETVSVGSLTASIVHPREVFKSALLSSAAAMVLVHNHPSGAPAPSREDLDITRRLKEGAELLGLRLLDHVIIGHGRNYSFADQGQL